MHHLRVNIRITMLAVAVAAVLLAGSLAQAPRQAEAAYTDVNGVICGAIQSLTLNTNPIPLTGIILGRIDHNLSNNAIAVTAVAYTDPGPGTPAVFPDCKTPQAPLPTGGTIVVPDAAAETRPGVFATYDKNNLINGTSCQADFTFGGFNLAGGTKVTLNLPLEKPSTAQSTGTFTFDNTYTDGTCGTSGGGLGVIVVTFQSVFLDGPDEAQSAFNSDWDKDGFIDWRELDPNISPFQDPFAPNAVGGVAELAEAAGTPLDAPDSSGASTGLIAGVLAAVAAGVVALGGAAWYAKRRL